MSRKVCVGSHVVPLRARAPGPAEEPRPEMLGRYVRVCAVGAQRYAIEPKSAWTTMDLGLPAVGLPLHGTLEMEGDAATISIFVPLVALLLAGGLVGGGILIGLRTVMVEPTVGNATFVLFWLGLVAYLYRSARRAIRRFVDDAVATLSATAGPSR